MGHVATCHCGAVRIEVADPPAEVTECNCGLCRRWGVLWFYCPSANVLSLPDAGSTEAYATGGEHVDFHRCRTCGCVTHWIPRDPSRDGRAINARLFAVEVLCRARVRHLDNAVTGEYLD